MMILALLLALSEQTPAAPAQLPMLACSYTSVRDHERLTIERCAQKDAQGRIQISRNHLGRFAYDRRGLTNIYVDGWYYLARNGRSAAVMAYDNGADEFNDGLARSPVGKKIGYIDRSLRFVIPARFDGAYPFENGLAVVCIGCRTVPSGEHFMSVDGEWGCIDSKGILVVALHPAATYQPCPPKR